MPAAQQLLTVKSNRGVLHRLVSRSQSSKGVLPKRWQLALAVVCVASLRASAPLAAEKHAERAQLSPTPTPTPTQAQMVMHTLYENAALNQEPPEVLDR